MERLSENRGVRPPSLIAARMNNHRLHRPSFGLAAEILSQNVGDEVR